LVVVVGLLPNWIFVFGCHVGWAVVFCVLLFCNVAFWMAAIFTWRTLWREWKEYNHEKHQSANHHTITNAVDEENQSLEITHLCIMVGYKEPMDLIYASVDSIANQTRAKSIIMVVGLEERTPDYETKCIQLHARYGDKFKLFLSTVHPQRAGEIAGTCSNVNWAIRESTTYLRDRGSPLDPKVTIITKCDTDTIFVQRHFQVLEREFLKQPPEERLARMYQSVLCYNIEMDQRIVFARVTGILRTFFMCGFMIPCNVNTMSIYSISLQLARQAGYWHPSYQMEDIIMNLILMNGIGKRVPIVLLPIPTLSGPTSGATYWQEFTEWRLQVRRWTIGAAEVFHYYVTKLLRGNFEIKGGLNYGFVFTWYYGIMLCVTGVFGLCSMWSLPAYGCMDSSQLGGWGLLDTFPWISPTTGMVFFFGFQYMFVYATAFAADAFHRSILGIKEPTLGFAGGIVGLSRSILHWLSSHPVLWAYSVVELLAIVELAFRGRKICAHIPTNKDSLMANACRQTSMVDMGTGFLSRDLMKDATENTRLDHSSDFSLQDSISAHDFVVSDEDIESDDNQSYEA
jgi:hypothetical protein